ncbi:MAG TPA: carbohydrate-binding family 9-like protein [Bryobacteraceae bacterium]|jgi:hypothetical protein
MILRIVFFCVVFAAAALCSQPVHMMQSKHASADVATDTNPDSAFWREAPAVIADRDSFGTAVPGHRTEVRSRWTAANLYFLFICPYEHLNLKPDPRTDIETNKLWEWDVAEAFIGSDFENIRQYKEFEVSPQGEWVDLDIDLTKPHHEGGWTWNSGFTVAARIDSGRKIWYACMRIPYKAIDTRSAQAGNTLRLNLYRSQGPKAQHAAIAWQPTHKPTFHAPEAFGTLKLVK